jgi:hypothetical protein
MTTMKWSSYQRRFAERPRSNPHVGLSRLMKLSLVLSQDRCDDIQQKKKRIDERECIAAT